MKQKQISQALRFKYYHQVDNLYHGLLDDIAKQDFGDGEIGRLAQKVMLSRQEALKHLVSLDEMEAYYEQYPDEKNV